MMKSMMMPMIYSMLGSDMNKIFNQPYGSRPITVKIRNRSTKSFRESRRWLDGYRKKRKVKNKIATMSRRANR